MIIERNVFQAKYGKGDELVGLFKQYGQSTASNSDQKTRLLTDRSGPFFTVVLEIEWKSLADWEKTFMQEFSEPALQQLMSQTLPLIESGRRDFYYIEAQTG